MQDLFANLQPAQPSRQQLADGAILLRRYALPSENELLEAMADIIAIAPLRHMTTPGGYVMSVAMTNCGDYGWVSEPSGYRYSPTDPLSGHNWPSMPKSFLRLATSAAQAAGYADFIPDACLINRYEVGTRLSLHQDKNEHDLANPIVSVSLGIPAVFQFGGLKRNDPVRKFGLEHGDVAVWGGPSRLYYHGILALKPAEHPRLGPIRYNLTFRKAF